MYFADSRGNENTHNKGRFSMNDKKLFSQYYSSDTSRHEDKEKFRNRLLKYLEDFVNANFPQQIYLRCRSQMGLDIEKISIPSIRRPGDIHYSVEKLFYKKLIRDILDFVTVCYDALAPHQDSNAHLKGSLEKYIEEVNLIFREESMCYVLHSDGRVRFYPDEEFHELIKCTLECLNKPKYKTNLTAFNNVLDDAYKNYCTESPINELFKVMEAFVLSLLKNNEILILNKGSIELLMDLLTRQIQQDQEFTENDCSTVSGFSDVFRGFTSMCHKYRHGKGGQQNNKVPRPLFNLIFSMGVSVFRFLLELDDKYQII